MIRCAKCRKLKEYTCFRTMRGKKRKVCRECAREIIRKRKDHSLEKQMRLKQWREGLAIEKQARLKQWRDSLDPSEQILFDRLMKDKRIRIIYGAWAILCEGSWISGILPSIADKNDLKIDENWFSEKGRANLHRIKWSNTPPPEKLSCRICGEPISNYQFEENDELCEECYEQESNTMEEEEFVSL